MGRSAGMVRGGTRLAAFLVAVWPMQALAETELSFYGGWQEVATSRMQSEVLGDAVVGWIGRPFVLPPYYGLRATWWRANGLGIGVEVNHAKAYAPDPAALGFDRLEFSDGLNLVTANLWMRLKPVGRLQPYVGVGLGAAIPHVDIQPAGQAHTFGYQVTGPAAQWVLGASMPLNDRWSLFGEYKGTYSSNHVLLDSGGTLDTDLRTDAFNLGVALRF
jgi:lipid A oxidase